MQQQQGAHEPGASQLSSIHSRSSAHVNQIQGDSSAQGKMSAGIGMLMEQRPGALPMGILILSLIAIFFVLWCESIRLSISEIVLHPLN